MPLQTAGGSGFAAAEAYTQIRTLAQAIKNAANGYLATLQGGPVNSLSIFSFLDQANGGISALNNYANASGLNTYATSQGYIGTMTSDVTAVISALQTCINTIVSTFPVDTGGFIQAFKLNADGSRVATNFSSAQTAGLQTNLQAVINSIS